MKKILSISLLTLFSQSLAGMTGEPPNAASRILSLYKGGGLEWHSRSCMFEGAGKLHPTDEELSKNAIPQFRKTVFKVALHSSIGRVLHIYTGFSGQSERSVVARPEENGFLKESFRKLLNIRNFVTSLDDFDTGEIFREEKQREFISHFVLGGSLSIPLPGGNFGMVAVELRKKNPFTQGNLLSRIKSLSDTAARADLTTRLMLGPPGLSLSLTGSFWVEEISHLFSAERIPASALPGRSVGSIGSVREFFNPVINRGKEIVREIVESGGYRNIRSSITVELAKNWSGSTVALGYRLGDPSTTWNSLGRQEIYVSFAEVSAFGTAVEVSLGRSIFWEDPEAKAYSFGLSIRI